MRQNMNKSQAGAGDDGGTFDEDSSGVNMTNQRAQDVSQPYASANDKSKSKSSPRKQKGRSPLQVDKSEYEDDDEYYDSEDSYGDHAAEGAQVKKGVNADITPVQERMMDTAQPGANAGQ